MRGETIREIDITMGHTKLIRYFDETLKENRFKITQTTQVFGMPSERTVIDVEDFTVALESWQGIIDWEQDIQQIRINTTNQL